MGSSSRVGLAIVAIVTLGPWAVYLAGICILTRAFNDSYESTWLRQSAYMLEWYEIWMELAILLLLLLHALIPKLVRHASYLQMWLAVNTALIIYSTTARLIQINRVDDGDTVVDGEFTYDRDDLTALRCLAAGQIAVAAENFILAIFLGVATAAGYVHAADHVKEVVHHPVHTTQVPAHVA